MNDLSTTLDHLLEERDRLTSQLLYLERCVERQAEEYRLVLEERDQCRERLAEVNQAIGDGDAPVIVE